MVRLVRWRACSASASLRPSWRTVKSATFPYTLLQAFPPRQSTSHKTGENKASDWPKQTAHATGVQAQGSAGARRAMMLTCGNKIPSTYYAKPTAQPRVNAMTGQSQGGKEYPGAHPGGGTECHVAWPRLEPRLLRRRGRRSENFVPSRFGTQNTVHSSCRPSLLTFRWRQRRWEVILALSVSYAVSLHLLPESSCAALSSLW